MLSIVASYFTYFFSNRALLRASAALLPLLGITWIFGFLAYDQQTVAFSYIFVILNSSQVTLYILINLYLSILRIHLPFVTSNLHFEIFRVYLYFTSIVTTIRV